MRREEGLITRSPCAKHRQGVQRQRGNVRPGKDRKGLRYGTQKKGTTGEMAEKKSKEGGLIRKEPPTKAWEKTPGEDWETRKRV